MARGKLGRVLATFAASVAVGVGAQAQEPGLLSDKEALVSDRPWETIEVAIALDTSGSMEFLIETARLKLWEAVSNLTRIKPAPRLRVALMTFGNNENPADAGWVRVEADFTEDLDLISDRLFELTSNGGNEYLGRVLQTAVEGLSWTASEETLKLLFVVGNEPPNQDPKVSVEAMTDVAVEAGIWLQVVFCGQVDSDEAKSWKQVAELAGGGFAAIDHRASPVAVETPFDAELVKLGSELNRTYVPLGAAAEDRQEKLAEQDEKVAKLSTSVAASRAEFKSSSMYSSGWDLVDATEVGDVDLYALEENKLPQNMRAMSLEERETYIQDMRARREQLRQRMIELSAHRRQYMEQAMEAEGIDASRSFDTVVRQAIRTQLERKGFYVPED